MLPKKPRSPKCGPQKWGKTAPRGAQGGLLRAEKGILPRHTKKHMHKTQNTKHKNKGVFYFRKTRIHHNKNQKNPRTPKTQEPKETKDARQLP